MAGGGVTTKVDAKRRPKSVKRKKPNESSAAAIPQGSLPSRIDGLSNTGSKSDSGIKLETSGDDSGINMTDTWQRNGHSADFIRQGKVIHVIIICLVVSCIQWCKEGAD